jgi:hypothetical protein
MLIPDFFVALLKSFNGKGLKAKHMIFVGLLHSNAGKHVIYNFS